MGRIREVLSRNKLYAGFLIFIIAINLLVILGWMAERQKQKEEAAQVSEVMETEEPTEEKKTIFDEEDVQKRQERIVELASENPRLYFALAILNLTILFVIFLGFLIDGYLVMRWVKKRPLGIRIQSPTPPKWTLADVFRVIIIFISFGYIFVILEGLSSRVLPFFKNENFRMVFNTALMNIVGISVIVHFVRRKYGQSLTTVGLSLAKVPKGIVFAAVGYIALIPVIILIMAGTFLVIERIGYKPPVQPIVEVFIEEKETSILWFSAIFAAIFGPVAEEIFFRGFMYSAAKKKFGIFPAILGTSVLFSLLHTHIVGFLPIMALGVLLAYLYEKTGTLVAPIAVHIMHNLGMVILVFLVKSIGT